MIAASLLVGVIGLALLILPGWLLAKSWRLPQPLLAGFVLSTVALFATVLALTTFHFSLALGPVALLWFIFLATAAWQRSTLRGDRESEVSTSAPWKAHWPLLLLVLPLAAVVVYRATVQPLSGVDTVFRWNYLAVQMWAQQKLDFYPPVSPSDYELYAWPDGIPPAVASLYFFIYRIAGATRPAVLAPLVVFQYVVLCIAGYALTRRRFSARSAAFACALMGAIPVAAWGVAMGQETGLLSVALVGMLLYLPEEYSSTNGPSALVAGACAALGGIAREYGLIWFILGLAISLSRRLPLRSLLIFSLPALLVPGLWYVRNWVRTGNPLFNLDLLGWFPVNGSHASLMALYQREYAFSHLSIESIGYMLANLGLLTLFVIIGTFVYLKREPSIVVAILVVLALWLSSVRYTAAGVTYSLRVLVPALALGAVLGGDLLSKWTHRPRLFAGAIMILSILAIDAAFRALTLPMNVYRLPTNLWPHAGGAALEYHARPIYRQIAAGAGNQRILTFGPNAQLTVVGAHTVPPWSPEVSFLFQSGLSGEEISARLIRSGISYVVFVPGALNEEYLGRSPLFRDAKNLMRKIWSDEDLVFLEIIRR